MDARYSPRAPLPIRWCYHRPGLSRGRSQSELPDLHRSYGLMRQTKILLPTSVSLFRQVFAGYCKPLLEDGPSRRYLCDPCMGAWVLTPPRLNGAFVRFFPLSIGLSLVPNFINSCRFERRFRPPAALHSLDDRLRIDRLARAPCWRTKSLAQTGGVIASILRLAQVCSPRKPILVTLQGFMKSST